MAASPLESSPGDIAPGDRTGRIGVMYVRGLGAAAIALIGAVITYRSDI